MYVYDYIYIYYTVLHILYIYCTVYYIYISLSLSSAVEGGWYQKKLVGSGCASVPGSRELMALGGLEVFDPAFGLYQFGDAIETQSLPEV